MAVSLAETLTTWTEAITKFESGDARGALTLFRQCQDQSAIMLFNFGAVHLKLRNYGEAITSFDSAIKKDQHMAAAYFQRALAHHNSNNDSAAAKDFDESHRRMRGTRVIDYRQLGMPCKLFECDVLLNSALISSRLGRSSDAQDKLSQAQDAQLEKRHEQLCRDVSSAVRQRGGNCPLVLLPESALFRPAKQKVANIKKKNFLGDAKVLSSVIDQDQFSGFMGKRELEDGASTPPVSRSPRSTSPLFGRARESHYKAIYSFEPNTGMEVALSEGDIVKVKKKDNDGWFTIVNVTTGQSGLVPGSYLEVTSDSPSVSPKRSQSTDFKFPGKKKMSTSSVDGSTSPLADASKSPPPKKPLPLAPGAKAPPPKAMKPAVAGKPGTSSKPPPVASKPGKPSVPLPVLNLPFNKSKNALSPVGGAKVTVKLHMDHTRVVQVSKKIRVDSLVAQACEKFQQEPNSLSLWYRVDGELTQLEEPGDLTECWRQADTAEQHLTLWVYASG